MLLPAAGGGRTPPTSADRRHADSRHADSCATLLAAVPVVAWSAVLRGEAALRMVAAWAAVLRGEAAVCMAPGAAVLRGEAGLRAAAAAGLWQTIGAPRLLEPIESAAVHTPQIAFAPQGRTFHMPQWQRR